MKEMEKEIKYWKHKDFEFSDLAKYEVGDYITLHDYGHMVINNKNEHFISFIVVDYTGNESFQYDIKRGDDFMHCMKFCEMVLKEIMDNNMILS